MNHRLRDLKSFLEMKAKEKRNESIEGYCTTDEIDGFAVRSVNEDLEVLVKEGVVKTENGKVILMWSKVEEWSEIEKKFEAEALVKNTPCTDVQLQEMIHAASNRKAILLVGQPGTGKSHFRNRFAELLLLKMTGMVNAKAITSLSFSESYSYSDFIEGYRPRPPLAVDLARSQIREMTADPCAAGSTSGTPVDVDESGSQNRGEGAFHLQNGILRNHIQNNKEGWSVIIIDEINRANTSEVFGELLTMMEDRDSEVTLRSGATVKLPRHCVVVGLMNPADQSLKPLSQAFLERFAIFRFPFVQTGGEKEKDILNKISGLLKGTVPDDFEEPVEAQNIRRALWNLYSNHHLDNQDWAIEAVTLLGALNKYIAYKQPRFPPLCGHARMFHKTEAEARLAWNRTILESLSLRCPWMDQKVIDTLKWDESAKESQAKKANLRK